MNAIGDTGDGTITFGPGWREADARGDLRGVDRVMFVDSKNLRTRVWVREVLPLPTEPGYYVADRPSYGETVVVELLGSPGDQWVDAGDRQYLTHEQVQAMGPLIRLERRDVTAKAVLDEFEVWNWDTSRDTVARIAQMFGVES